MFHGARFEEDPEFDTRNHIHTTQLPEPAGKNELEALVRVMLSCFSLRSAELIGFIRWVSLLLRTGTSPSHSGRW